MFEGLVRQLLLGYLGQYIKDIHREQLKITLWNEEVLLENVELILEAFDYLQLPFALKQGRVGRLSIKIPWKKLGWDPIIIILEDVLISACQRDDEEWSMDAVERREFSGKKAKLAAAELGKLSRRVCDNQAGKSFLSYLTAKILDGIQVSIRNFHVAYCNMPTDSAHTLFGLKFSSLTAVKQNLTGLKVRGGQVNKLVEIKDLEIYCGTFHGTLDLTSNDNADDSVSRGSARFQSDKCNLLAPVDVSMSLVVNRSGRLENNAPQYSVNVELTELVMSLDEVQLQQILILCDYLCMCRLRDTYGRYRPWWSPLSKRLKGWQIAWWHYAQQSVLSDVRKRLRKSSWKYLGERLHKRRKYVKLYKTKLECLREEQLLEDNILWELEQIEKESDIEDILSYRSAAERELQELLASSSGFGAVGADIAVDKSLHDEHATTKPRGWLNWLSRGMLGAGGTADSSQFSGVVSDEVIKDIYEATKFHPMPSLEAAASDEILLSSVKLSIRQISTTLRNKSIDCPIAELIFDGTSVDCMIWEEFAVVTASINTVDMMNPLNKHVIITRATFEESVLQMKNPFLNIIINVPRVIQEGELSIQVMIEPLEVTYDSTFLLNIIELYAVLESFKSLQERVLLSLNRIDDVKARVESKAEYILSRRKRLKWDASFIGVKIIIPWENAKSELHNVVMESGAFSFASKRDTDFIASDMQVPAHVMKNFLDSVSTTESLLGLQLHDLYDHFEIKLNDLEVKMFIPSYSHTVSVLEKLNASITLSSCIVPDESLLKALEVYVDVSSLFLHFSPSIYSAMRDLFVMFSMLKWKSDTESKATVLLDVKSKEPKNSRFFGFSGILSLGTANFLVELENDFENSCTLMVSLQELDVRFAITDFPECLICTKALKIVTRSPKSNEDGHILCSSEHTFPACSAQPREIDFEVSNQCENCDENSTCADGCFLLHYEVRRKLDLISHSYTIWVSDLDLHCYPHIVGLLVGFSDKINGYHTSHAVKDRVVVEGNHSVSASGFEFQKFGYSNFYEAGSSEWSSIPLGHYPFITIENVGSLLHIDSSLIYPVPEWRNFLKLRESKIRSPGFSVKKGYEKLNVSSTVGKYVFSAPPGPFDTVLVVVNLNLSSIRVHFHDSSCIVGTVTLCGSKSALSFHEDSLDILCSTEGLNFSSSWWSQTLQDFLWGPSLPNISPILNVRVRKGNFGSLSSVFEISFSIQHVSCTLPPEYLAIIIGYFSLPDWSSTLKDQPVTDTDRYMDTEISTAITYKFEILDSILFTPVESVKHQFLKLDIRQLYCSFIHKSNSDILLKDIPAECLVPAHKVADKSHCLNLFGRDLFLSLLLPKDDTSDSFKFIQNIEQQAVSLIAPISVDVWIRIPHELESHCASSFASTCVMSRISNCQLVAEGADALVGFEALQDVIDQFSSVPSQSQGFTSDVLQFLLLKRRRKENNPLPPESSVATFTEIKCSVHSMLVKLYSKTDSTVYKHIAESEMRFICSASLKDDKPLRLDLSFSSLALLSSLRSVILVECTSPSQVLSVLATSFSLSDEGENELHVALPSVDIWLHLSDWSGILDLFSIYSTQVSKSSTISTPFKKSTLDPEDPIEDMPVDISKCSPESQSVSSYFLSETIKHDDLCFVAKSENVGIKIHIPVQVRKEAFRYLGEPQVHDQSPPDNLSNLVEGGQYCFVVVTLQSRCCELIINGHLLRLKSNLDKTSGTVELSQHKSVHSWPFFQLLQVNVEAEIRDNQMEHMQVIAEVQCESFDVCLSHHIFYFWQCMLFELPGSGSSQFPWCRGHFKIQLGKLSLLLTDRKWSSNGPLLEVLVRNFVLDAKVSETKVESSVDGELRVNYNNIHKVFWEPFVEPWKFQLTMSREYGKRSLLNSPIMTDIHLESTSQLNLNVTESFIEVVFWAIDMIKDAWDLMALNVLSENPRSSKTATNESAYTGRYAPYILQNFTSLPLVFHVCEGPLCTDGLEVSVLSDGNFVQPGSSYPVYIDETPEEQFFDFSGYSYGRLIDKQRTGAVHRYITIQLEGTSILSTPISMDLVGVSYVEVDFSKSSNNPEVGNIGDFSNAGKEQEGNNRINANNGYVIPVVIDVSVLRHTKLVRLYSTVILLNSTSVPFEVRFDIPFGVSPKILDPIYPGQEFPLPLHLAEAGRIRWRPLGSTYLWSEAYSISSILSHESRIGFLRSFVCYPSLPSSDPFRCCITVHDMCLPSVGKRDKGSSLYINDNLKQSLENCSEVMHHPEGSKKRFIHLVTLSSPLVVKNYLPVAVSVTVESGGVTRSVLLSEAETSFFHIDSSHDLAIAFQMLEFRAAVLNFPRVETFGAIAKFSGTKFSLSETIAFDSDFSKGPLYVTMEKVLDAFSGAREICISVPFLLYNCCGFSLSISNSGNEMNTHACTVPSCYDSDEQNLLLGKKDGLGLISSNHDLRMAPSNNCPRHSSINNHVVSTRKSVDTHDSKFGKKSSNFSGSSSFFHGSPDKEDLDARISSGYSGRSCSGSSSQADMKSTGFKESDNKKANFCMYSPDPNSSPNEVMVKVSRCISESVADNIPNCSWSSPFFIVPPTGSTSVLVPQKSANAAYIISATSSVVAGPFSGRTRIISFQPRYVISNACSKDLCYKQKGSEYVFHLKIGQNSHIQWTDLTRDLLVSVRFNEPGWQWSGCFVPEHLGDTQLKMRNYVSGAVNMIRVEVQNADVSIRDEKLVGNPHGNSGTYLILLSDDDTGFMPYRIDNFSKERLRVYQQRCEAFETVIHSYTSCSYAWDEPCYPHRLTVEVPAERIIGSYTLDDAKDHKPVYLPATSEKPERTLLVSIHSEGAMKVLSVIDSSYHILDDMKGPHVPRSNEEREHQQEHGTSVVYKERISVAIPFIGISMMNSSPQELLFACAKNTVIDLVQSLDQQKYSLEISSLQIDNQLQSTPYPVILSFDHEYRSNPMGNMRTKDSQKIKSERIVQLASDHSHEPVFSLAAVKWRNKDITLVSFEYISLRVADCHLELEQEVILSLFDFFKMASSRFQSRVLPNADTFLHPTLSDFSFVKRSSISPEAHEFVKAGVAQIHSTHVPLFVENDKNNPFVPSIVPIGAPWQQIYLLARKQKKVYVERFDLAPIKLTLSFSSSPWMLRNGVLTSGEYLIHRGLMALADVEGAQIHLKQLTIAHQLASWESIREILIRHYTRQLLHEMYKVFGSAGVIGNPMGFARSVGLGIKDFLSVPARSFMQSPAGLIGGMAQGTTSLLSNTVYAVSDAATQFSRAVHKGIIAFTFDDPAAVEIEKQQKGMSSHSKGVINEFLEGLTGLLQSPIKGAEKHGLPGVLSGIALGVTGLVARPAASILEVTGKTAQSIRNRSKLYHRGSQCFRIRLPRPLSKDSPLKPYLWEEAVATSVLANAGDSLKLKNEVPVMSKALRQGGKFVIVTKRLILIVSCSSLVNLGKPDFRGVPTDPEWVIEAEIGMDSIIHADTDEEVVHIVGSSSDTLSRQNQHQQKRGVVLRGKQWYSSPTPLPLFQTNLEFQLKEEAVDFLRVLLSAIEKGKQQGWGSVYRLHQINVK